MGAKVNATGQTKLTGDYPTQAKVTVAGLDIGRPLALFGRGSIKAQSSINGVATVSGPLKTPKALSGRRNSARFDVKLQGIELKAAEPLRIGLRDGVATLEQVHITGQDTDMRASGTQQVFGSNESEGRQAGCEGDRKCEHDAAAYVRPGHYRPAGRWSLRSRPVGR